MIDVKGRCQSNECTYQDFNSQIKIRKIEDCAVRDLGLFAWDGPDGPTRWWAFPHTKCGTFNFDGTDKILLCTQANTGEICHWCKT